jgi:MFS family permease
MPAEVLGGYVLHATRQGSAKALIDVSLFARRTFAAPAAVGFAFSFMMQGALVLYPLYWQIVRGESALRAGMLVAPQGLGSVITNTFNGRLSDRYGAARLAPVGLVILLGSTLVWATMDAHTSYAVLAGASFLRGLGISFLGTPAYAAAYQSLAPDEVPRGTTAYNIGQRCGSAFGVAVVIVVLQHSLHRVVPVGAAHGLSAGTLGTLARHGYANSIAHSFSQSFVVLSIFTALTFIPALMLPWRGAHDRA